MPNKPNIPEPPQRRPSAPQLDAREPRLHALKGGAVGVSDSDTAELSANESEREMLDRINRGRFRRIF
jgi:hypothetical protein